MTEQQQQFDWHKESGKCVEGLRLAVGEDIEFELDYDNIELKAAMKKQPDGSKIPLTDKKTGAVRKTWRIPFIEVQSKITKNLDFWANDNYRVNQNAPEVEDDFVKFSRRLGYNPVLGGDFVPEDFLKRGTRIICQLKPQNPSDPANKYTEIDISTIRLADGSGGESQASLPDDPELVAEVLGLVDDKVKKFSDLVKKINTAKRTKDLLPVAMKMKSDGTLDLK